MIEVHPKMVTILRGLHFVLSKSVKCNWRYHGRQFEKRGFEINAFEILCLYVLTKDIARQKRLELLKYFEIQKILLGRYSQICKL